MGAYSANKLTEDHILDNKDELKRIQTSGGLIINNKIGGKTIVTRCIGDHTVKRFGLISSPHISKHILTGAEKWIVLGSSGLWSVIKEEDISRIVIGINTAEEFGKPIIQLAKNRGVRENISIIVIGLYSDYYY